MPMPWRSLANRLFLLNPGKIREVRRYRNGQAGRPTASRELARGFAEKPGELLLVKNFAGADGVVAAEGVHRRTKLAGADDRQQHFAARGFKEGSRDQQIVFFFADR